MTCSRLALLALSLGACNGAAESPDSSGFDPYAGPGLVAVLETGNHLDGIAPDVVLYDDGSVVFRVDEYSDYVQARLDESALADARSELMPTDSWQSLDGYYDLMPNGADDPEQRVLLRGPDGDKAVWVYGLAPDEAGSRSPPAEFERIVQVMRSLKRDSAEPWKPTAAAVWLHPSEGRTTMMAWPSGWPRPGGR